MDKLQKLLDIEDIKNLKHRYFRAIDMADFDLLDNIFTDDIPLIIEAERIAGNLRAKKQLPKVFVTPFTIKLVRCIQAIIRRFM